MAFKISIHAPTRGATCNLLRSLVSRIISIHAPTRGATLKCLHSCLLWIAFQSTLPRGERPTKGWGKDMFLYFNPRSHEGSDIVTKTTGADRPISIHAPTRGATRDIAGKLAFLIISIHAPTRGATDKTFS